MYTVIKNRIAAGGFKLADIQHKVKKLYAMGDLTDEQLNELMLMSQQNAATDAERPETLAMLQNLADRVGALEKKLTSQDSSDTERPEYEIWTAWDGISNNYQKGAIVSHRDKLWLSVFNGQNVWEPGIVGTERMWVEYTSEKEEE